MKTVNLRGCRDATVAGCVALVVALTSGGARAQEISYFRHDGGTAPSDSERLPEALEDAVMVWKQSLPPGHSTPCIAGDQIFLTGRDDAQLVTVALDRASGRQQWRQGIQVEQLEKFHAEGSPAAATPACDGQRVYVFFGSYGLACYDLAGTPVWSKRLGPFRDEFGAASSPMLLDGKVVLCEDHDLDSFVMAARSDDGKTVWQTAREGFTRSYSTPVAWTNGGEKQLVVSGALQLVAYDVRNGRPRWSLDGFARIVNTTPAVADDMLYVCTWSPGGDTDARIAMEPWATALQLWDKNGNAQLENSELPAGEVRSRFFRIDLNSNQALDETEWNKYAKIFELAQNTLVALRASADPQTPPTIVWQYKRGLPYVPSPLVYRGQVYLIKDGGVLTVLDAATGKLSRQSRAAGEGNYYSSPVGGDGKVYVASGGGTVTVFEAAARPEVLSSRDFGERIAATPVISDGRIYIRTEKALYAFGRR
jgi:outer membrane protein assembly factor BamB